MIFLWGLPGDRPLIQVRDALYRLGCKVAFLDQRLVLKTQAEVSVGARVGGTIWAPDLTIDLAAVRAVYARPYDTRRLPDVAAAGEGSPAWQHALHLDDVLWSWIDLTPALVVNPTAATAANGSKPFQTQWIRSFGFAVPETLITTDPAAALAFWKEQEQVIYKSVSGVRSIVSRLKPEDEDRLPHITWCPTQFQTYVPGIDYRVHVVGQEIFACELKSAADDYRYAHRQGSDINARPFNLPADCAARCRTMAAAMGLAFAGIDLRLTPAGEWYCFEVNPSPGFSYFQHISGHSIDDAVARLLAGGTRGG
jgi:hypothetical protein